MEDDLNESSSSMLPVALTVLAIALGGAGLYFGMTANQRLDPLSENMEASSGSAARVEKQLANFETKLAELSAQNDELKKTVNRLRVYSSQSERDAKQALSGVKANREEMVKLVETLNQSGPKSPRAEAASVSVVSDQTVEAVTAANEASSPTNIGSATTYNIQSGDNFAKIASAKGISLQALLDANPGVDPRALQIGQAINIPAN
ncbi:MAG TPA: hypothetical protein DCX06_13815 [Opitutae bacterium]|nr:hypothetical protein [Opitutae bacterium]